MYLTKIGTKIRGCVTAGELWTDRDFQVSLTLLYDKKCLLQATNESWIKKLKDGTKL